MPVICLLNQKGGVGKTSTCHHLAGTLARDRANGAPRRQRPPEQPDPGLLGADGHPADRPGRDDRRHPRRTKSPTPPSSSSRPGSPASTSSRARSGPRASTSPTRTWPTRRCSSRSGSSSKRSRGRTTYVLIDCPPNLHLCSWVGPGRERLPDRPAQARGLRRPGDHRRPGVGRPGALRAQPGPQAPGLPHHPDERPEEHPQALRGDACAPSSAPGSSRPG